MLIINGRSNLSPIRHAGSVDFPTIQSALDSLPATGGEVYVLPGEYKESLRITTPNVKLSGTWAAKITTPDTIIKNNIINDVWTADGV